MKSPILSNKNSASKSVFDPKALLREARRQKHLQYADVPAVCLFDPDGDIVRHLRRTGRSKPFEQWPCYHTQLDVFEIEGRSVGIIGCVVGASFAVLVAEELFASGCEFLVSITSAGQVVEAGELPYFVAINRALRDEGTSYHYAEPSEFAEAKPELVALARDALSSAGLSTIVGPSWTTDAPFRETQEALEDARSRGILAVEMEAAALYSFANYSGGDIICFAHITNTMGQTDIDFEKGADDGAQASLALLAGLLRARYRPMD